MQLHLPMHTIVLVTATCMYVTLKKPNSIIRKAEQMNTFRDYSFYQLALVSGLQKDYR